MYNRYIPQPDGTYKRNRQPSAPMRQPPTQAKEPSNENEIFQKSSPPHGRILDFFKNLLPGNLDTADLLIILLLLLMAGDKEDNHSAMLTLVLYLFM